MNSENLTQERIPASLYPADYTTYIAEAMDYIIRETLWAEHFPEQCHDRIRQVCETVKAGRPMPQSTSKLA